MREIKRLIILGIVFALCLTCGKENPPDVEVTPVQEEVLSPEAAVLLRPVKDEVCTSGVSVSEKFSRKQTSLLTRYFLIMVLSLGILLGTASLRFDFLLRGL